MNAVIRTLLLKRLETSELDEAARNVVIAALPDAVSDAAAAPPAYLRSVSVEGFRGIAGTVTLSLDPKPGLVVVVGRNGSGKSSFAEALELLMTGETKRWHKKTKAWTDTWQCLHHDGPTRVAAEFALEGGAAVALERTWPRGAAFDSVEGRPEVDAVLAQQGWREGVAAFRPFLSYAELATMFENLNSLYTALSPVLGLDDVDDLLEALAARRLELEKADKSVSTSAAALAARLEGSNDPRAADLVAALGARKRDLDAIAALAASPAVATPEGEADALHRLAGVDLVDVAVVADAFDEVAAAQQAAAQAGTASADRARTVAGLLNVALELDDQDCPVCGTEGVLSAAWRKSAAAQAAALQDEAREVDAAARRLTAARQAVAALSAPLVSALADARAASVELVDPGGVLAGALSSQEQLVAALAALSPAREDARRALVERDGSWRELLAEVRGWLNDAREGARQAERLKSLKAAEKWLKGVNQDLLSERFAPIRDAALSNWAALRHESNVDLHAIDLKRSGKSGRADFDVRADGEQANALGVMSQGELLALSVSVFLPRASLPESPFRFSLIDDPVQAMDPAKVDGLARVLHAAAATRQVIVFTHDERLPESIRRLRLDAVVLHVERRSRSAVSVAPLMTPVRRHLVDARKMIDRATIPPTVRDRVVPGLCRSAVEAAATDLVRRGAVADGRRMEDVDEAIRSAHTTRDLLALAVFGDPSRGADVAADLRARPGLGDAAKLIRDLNAGVHGDLDSAAVGGLVDRTRDFIVGLEKAL